MALALCGIGISIGLVWSPLIPVVGEKLSASGRTVVDCKLLLSWSKTVIVKSAVPTARTISRLNILYWSGVFRLSRGVRILISAWAGLEPLVKS